MAVEPFTRAIFGRCVSFVFTFIIIITPTPKCLTNRRWHAPLEAMETEKTSITESENPFTKKIDRLDTLDMLELINDEDRSVPAVITAILDEIASVTDAVYQRLAKGGRLFYVGSGTSGRLGVLDAAELPPTFGVSPELVTGVIAGGYGALFKAAEASEDSESAGADDLQKQGLLKSDAVIGITASGSTPYTIGAVDYAKSIGCFTACITCNPDSPISEAVEIPLVAVVGPEVITGSTRLKAGTAQKLILNMISTAVMIKLGYVRGNRMVNLKASNTKLSNRSIALLESETGLENEEAKLLFESAGRDLKTALVMNEAGVEREIAEGALRSTSFSISEAVSSLEGEPNQRDATA